ncbi:MAG: T9SS type A sorting domain-containing protein [Flavobacteriales bacterium]
MRPPARSAIVFSCFLCGTVSLSSVAQDIPTDVIGDTGWTLFGSDTIVLVRAADGNAWTQQNMGAQQVATSFNDPTAFGGLFQWGRWQDEHSIPTSATAQASTLSPNNPLGLGIGSDKFYIGSNPSDWWGAGTGTDTWSNVASATSGIDPCLSLGTGWQLPTQAQWTAVIGVEGITNTATAFDSNLKLAAAGARDGGSGVWINAGLYGQYWSTTASGPYAKDLTVGDTWVNPDDDALRSYGMCVRCLNSALHLGIQSSSIHPAFGIFPNPSSGTITIDGGTKGIERASVFTPGMQCVGTFGIGATSTTMTLEVPDGLYMLKIETADGITWERLVVER